jgi:hypothetical protein
MTERERRAMLRSRPDVTCWESFLTEVAARRAGVAQPAAVSEPVPEPVSEPVPVSVAAPSAPARGPVALPTPLVPAVARSVQVTGPERLSEAA